ncbi:MAG: fucose isomerase [Chloroflexi bacterium]|nr:fucose isomerase [Chloroflexota bacterium]
MITPNKQPTIALIVGNRGFFPSKLCEAGRATALKVLAEEGIRAIALSPEDTPYGSVESLADARKCADLFKKHRDEIDGVLVTLPNFGDERAIANTLRWAELGVPVLVHAFPDSPESMTISNRRDSFCGKMSACNNLRQYGIKFSLTASHTVAPESESFRQDLRKFVATCKIVRGLKGIRIGSIGARPAAFNTVRYSEKLLEGAGITIETIDLFDVMGRVEKIDDDDARVQAKLAEIQNYVSTRNVPPGPLLKMAKFGAVIDAWMQENDLAASAVQCWTALQDYFGIVPCTIMSMMSNKLMPSACEVDVVGAVAMVALTLASDKPSAIVDWNNNYGDDPNKGVIFHCANLPKAVFGEEGAGKAPIHMLTHDILSSTVDVESSWGTLQGRISAKPFTYARISTDDLNGKIVAYVGEGELTQDPLTTFGGYGVFQIPHLQKLLHHICENGFEHHTAMNLSLTADAVYEAFSKYMGWETYYHHG